MSYADQRYSGQGKERLIQAVTAISDSLGMITLRVDSVPQGFAWQGSLTVTGAPSGALFTAQVANTTWGQWVGPTNFGPVDVRGSEPLVVTGVGLQKNTRYSMLFVGVAMPEWMADPLPPVAPTSTVNVETVTLLVQAKVVGTGNPTDRFTIHPPPLTRRLTFVISIPDVTGTDVSLFGTTTLNFYYSNGFSNGIFRDYIEIEPAIDAEYTFTFFGGGPGKTATIWVVASTTSPLVSVPNTTAIGVFGVGASSTTPPINVAGSPVGTFKNSTSVNNGAGSTTVLVGAPGAGNSIYIQYVAASNFTLAGGALCNQIIETTGGQGIAEIALFGGGSGFSKQIVFPGGLALPANTGLQARNNSANGSIVSVGWTTGSTL